MLEQVEAKNIVESWYENYDPEDKNNYLIDIIETIDALMCDKNFSLVDEICSKLFNDKNELTMINLTVLCITNCSLCEYKYKY
jgi:hypothetical protein